MQRSTSDEVEKGRPQAMSRNISYMRPSAIHSDRLPGIEIPETVRSRTPRMNLAYERKPLPLYRWNAQAEDGMDEILSTALAAQEQELAHILREVDRISLTLNSMGPDTQILNQTLQRTVRCAIRQSLLDKELRSLALTDGLTSLYNRRAFFALAGQQLKVTRRKAQGLLLFFADVNNLKEINDTYGHGEGDKAIVRAAQALEQTFRNSDVIARLGGDEFAVLALEASCEDQAAILRRLEKSLKESSANEHRYDLSLSVGMARFDPKHPVSLGKLMSMADEAMYDEKKNRLRPRLVGQ